MTVSTVVQINYKKKLSNGLPCCHFWQTGRVTGVDENIVKLKFEVYWTADPNDPTEMQVSISALALNSMQWQNLETWSGHDLQIYKQFKDDCEGKQTSFHEYIKELLDNTQEARYNRLAGADFQKAWEWAIGMFK